LPFTLICSSAGFHFASSRRSKNNCGDVPFW
jgi:hypothetical protein